MGFFFETQRWRTWVLGSLLLGPLIANEPVLGLRPLGTVDATLMRELQTDLEACMICKVILLPTVPMPASAYYPSRHRYRADGLLDALARLGGTGAHKLVGITQVDISTTKGAIPDWGIFGLGLLGGRTCVISTFRLGARGANSELRRERMRRVVRHEVLHTFGLEHCPTSGCVMEDAQGGIASVDRGDGSPCQICRKQVPGLWR